jgi:hypothetical protein
MLLQCGVATRSGHRPEIAAWNQETFQRLSSLS